MDVFIAHFGRGNALWDDCKRSSVISTFFDQDAHEFWRARDKRSYIDLCVRSKTTAAGKRPTRAVASKWYNAGDIIANTGGDLWLHRDGEDLWWTMSTAQPMTETIEFVSMPGIDARVYVLRKPAEPWRNQDKRGRRLQWSALHPKARDFLTLESTLQRLSVSNAEYATALVHGDELDAWHAQGEWLEREAKAGRGPVRSLSPEELSARRMAHTAFVTAANSNGQEETRVVKVKNVVGFIDEHDLAAYVLALYEKQNGRCAISGIALQHQREGADPELVCSLDRIDSDGHYERDNLQVVCCFVNRWKSDSADGEFRRLLRLVRSE